MKSTLKLVAVAFSVASITLASQAGKDSECGACPSTKTAAAATCNTPCASAKGSHVMLKLKRGDADAIRPTLAKLEGFQAAETCCQSKFTTISFDKEKACSTKIMTALKAAGYKVQAQRATFAVDGMACGACGNKVSKALAKLKGISDAKVCSESKKAVVDFNPARISSEKILATLDASGFKATEVLN